jgi:hypothetical protein
VASRGGGVAFYTVSDHGFFPGTVALLNSLSLTNPGARLVILDNGLLPHERGLLEGHSDLVDLPETQHLPPWLQKAYPRLLEKTAATVVLVDSDILITGSLAHVLRLVEAGKICVYPDHPEGGRWFPEWSDALALEAALRRERYVNAGFIAFSLSAWPHLLERVWSACERIPLDRPFGGREDHPFWAGDQDAWNALLMSEIAREDVAVLDERESPYPDALYEVEIVDEATLACAYDGHRVTILHEWQSPKPWQPRAWTRPRRDAYVRLLPRVLFADDLPIQLSPADFPLILRPTRAGRVSLALLSPVHRTISRVIRAAPPPLRTRLLALARKLRAG